MSSKINNRRKKRDWGEIQERKRTGNMRKKGNKNKGGGEE
jgi:hypothetical protein